MVTLILGLKFSAVSIAPMAPELEVTNIDNLLMTVSFIGVEVLVVI